MEALLITDEEARAIEEFSGEELGDEFVNTEDIKWGGEFPITEDKSYV